MAEAVHCIDINYVSLSINALIEAVYSFKKKKLYKNKKKISTGVTTAQFEARRKKKTKSEALSTGFEPAAFS